MDNGKQSLTSSMMRWRYIQHAQQVAGTIEDVMREIETMPVLDLNLMCFMLIDKRLEESLKLVLEVRDKVFVDNGIRLPDWERQFKRLRKKGAKHAGLDGHRADYIIVDEFPRPSEGDNR